MNRDDPFNSFMREYENLTQEWHDAYERHRHARSALTDALTHFGTRDPRLQAAHSGITQAKQALSELQQIQERMKSALDRVGEAVD